MLNRIHNEEAGREHRLSSQQRAVSDSGIEKLMSLFNAEFLPDYNTVLESGGEEPLYEPASHKKALNRIVFTKDYFASALHEIAHWCIAGEERLKHVDYGYWYAPDGRDTQQQQLFESVEVKPQALEWIFSVATGSTFKISADNLSGDSHISPEFKSNIVNQAINYCEHGLTKRALRFVDVLSKAYGVENIFDQERYRIDLL